MSCSTFGRNIYSKIFALVFATFLFAPYGFGLLPYCYDSTAPCGPKNWTGYCNTGLTQSPINIIKSSCTKISKPGNRVLIFSSEWFETKNFQMWNSGRGIVFGPYAGAISDLQIKGTGFEDPYNFLQGQFLWDSEHVVDGERFPLELKLVHNRPNATIPFNVMVSILFTYTKPPQTSKALAPLISMISKGASTNLLYQGTPQKFSFKLSTLLPNLWDIYRYNGSATRPPCTPNVIWNIFTQKMPISKAQVEVFSKVLADTGKLLGNNFRPLQQVVTAQRTNVYWMPINKTIMRMNVF